MRSRGVIERLNYEEAIKNETAMRPQTQGMPNRRMTFAQYREQQAERKTKAEEQQENLIGPFDFGYDDACESDVLNSAQVYQDLKNLEKILGEFKSQSHVALGTMKTKKRKNR